MVTYIKPADVRTGDPGGLTSTQATFDKIITTTGFQTEIPSVINDVSRQFFEYVGETNREKLHNRSIAYAFQNPIIDPSGTRDPFHYNIEKFYGASDH